jgi:ABC-type dipeptide/oligopeptide/nickel transport system permease subunit
MPGAIEVGGDVSAAAAALAGLLLVFIGAISTTFDGYERQEQGTVRSRYQRRTWFAFAGFLFAILAAAAGIAAKAFHQECVAVAGMVCLVIALGVSLIVGFLSAMELR